MTRPIVYEKPKQPAEIVHLPGFDFKPALTLPGEKISTVSDGIAVIVERRTGINRTSSMLVVGSVGVSNNVVALQVKTGSDNIDYLITLRPVSDAPHSRIVEGDIILPVRERVKSR